MWGRALWTLRGLFDVPAGLWPVLWKRNVRASPWRGLWDVRGGLWHVLWEWNVRARPRRELFDVPGGLWHVPLPLTLLSVLRAGLRGANVFSV